jgi:hypothetical protein
MGLRQAFRLISSIICCKVLHSTWLPGYSWLYLANPCSSATRAKVKSLQSDRFSLLRPRWALGLAFAGGLCSCRHFPPGGGIRRPYWSSGWICGLSLYTSAYVYTVREAAPTIIFIYGSLHWPWKFSALIISVG